MAQAAQKKLTSLSLLPVSERPRERLFEQGVDALSDAELLALFLRSGIPGENVRDLAGHLLQNFGGLSGLVKRSSQELLQVPGLGPAKVAALQAAFEIGNRILMERIEKRPLVDSAEDLFRLLHHSLAKETEEVFLGVLLNSKNEILKKITFAREHPTHVSISISRIMRILLQENPAAVIFVHNHPSGDPTPSTEDGAFTRRLGKACRLLEIVMHDHLIIGTGTGTGTGPGMEMRIGPCAATGPKPFFSFAQEGLL